MGRRRGKGFVWAIVFGLLLMSLACGVAIWRLFFFVDAYRFARPPGPINVGDCLTEYKSNAQDLHVVACTDATAKWQIVDLTTGQTYADARRYCDTRSASTVVLYDQAPPWEESTRGTAVCLTPKTAG